MIGLLIKDLYTLKRQVRIVAIISAIYFAMSIASNNPGMFSGIAMMYTIILPITAMAHDEQCKWDRFALAMPLSRTAIVLSKYVLGLLLNLVGSLMVCAAYLVFASLGFGSSADAAPMALGVSAGLVAVGLVFMSVILPLIYRFGVEKARLIMVIVFVIPFALSMAVSRLQVNIPLALLLEHVYLLPPAAVGMVLVSLYISIQIYRRKEF